MGVGFEEPHLRLKLCSSWDRGFREFPVILHIYTARHRVGSLVLWYGFEGGRKAGNYMGSSIGIVFVVLGRRIFDGKPGVFPARHEPCSQSLIVHENNKAVPFSLKQTTHTRGPAGPIHEYLLIIRQT